MTNRSHLHRIRWAVRITLLLGVAASVAANVLHARTNPISQTIAAWPPVALLLTVELISRVPVHRRSLATVRLVATAAIASIAAWVSYWHMVGVTARYGETTVSAHLMPISVDGLIVVASISLVELAGRIRTLDPQPPPPPPPTPTTSQPPTVDKSRPPEPAPVSQPVHSTTTPTLPVPVAAPVPAELLSGARILARAHRQATGVDITPDLLAERMRLPQPVADNILTTLAGLTDRPTTTHINGAPIPTTSGTPS